MAGSADQHDHAPVVLVVRLIVRALPTRLAVAHMRVLRDRNARAVDRLVFLRAWMGEHHDDDDCDNSHPPRAWRAP